jgi:L-asparaginase
LLHHLVDVPKPVVLTAAMRPATAVDADGPGNLRDAVGLVRAAAAQGRHGVVAVLGGRAWAGAEVRKAHSHEVDAFDGGGAPALAETDAQGQWPQAMPVWPAALARGWALLAPARPPRVELVCSHADADGWLVDALLAHSRSGSPTERLRGLVVAATGHGTLHQGLEAALGRAEQAGVVVWRSSRTAQGGVLSREGDRWPAAGPVTAAQARVALLLSLLSPVA